MSAERGAVEFLTERGYTVLDPGESFIERRDNDALLRSDWNHILKTLRMCEDRVIDGATLRIDCATYPIETTRLLIEASIRRSVHTILETAEIKSE